MVFKIYVIYVFKKLNDKTENFDKELKAIFKNLMEILEQQQQKN